MAGSEKEAPEKAPVPATTPAKAADDGSPRSVELVDPNGGVTLVSHPASLNSLVFGSGYKVKDRTVDQAAAYLAGEDA